MPTTHCYGMMGFEDDVRIDEVSELTVFDAYEVSIEDSWPSFIRDQSL